jgi:predicted nucleic acid-binding protein
VTVYYLDASALAKRYLVEIGTDWIRVITHPEADTTIVVSEITLVEVSAAIGARHRAATITDEERIAAFDLLVRHATEEYQLIAVDPMIIDRAMHLTQTRRLRGYDAVQLATGLVVNESYLAAELPELVFVSADHDLLDAAQAEGLAIADPNEHS